MAVRYDIYETPRTSENEESTYHIRVLNLETVTTDKIASQIQLATSQTIGDVKGMLSSLSFLLLDNICRGKCVHLEGIGYFQLSATLSGITDPKTVRAEQVTARTITFVPEKKIKASLSEIEFVRSKFKSHSQPQTMEEIQRQLEEYFETHAFISREEFQTLCGLTRTTSLRRINKLLETGVLQKTGIRNAPVYVLKK